MKRWMIGIGLVVAVVAGIGGSVFAQDADAQSNAKLIARLDLMDKQIAAMDQKLDAIQETQTLILQEVKKVMVRVHRS